MILDRLRPRRSAAPTGTWTRPVAARPSRATYDAVVVGGGVRALAIARACALRGASVLLLAPGEISGAADERAFPVVRATHADPGRIALQVGEPARMAAFGRRLVPSPHAERTGLVEIAASEDAVADIAATAERAKAHGVAAWMVPAREVGALSGPLAGGRGLAPALFEPDAVTLDVDALAFALADAAIAAGAELLPDTPVVTLQRDGPRVTGVEFNGVALPAAAVMLADDASAIRLVREGKGRLSLKREERMILVTELRAPPLGPAVVLDDVILTRDQTGAATISGPAGADALAARIVDLAPAYGRLTVGSEEPVTLWTGIDGRAQIGPAEIDGLWLALGFGRDALSPAFSVADHLAAAIGGAGPAAAFEAFAPTRRPRVRIPAGGSR